MARIRTIKPEFWKHEGLSELPEATHMLAASLLNYSDDEGYFNANPNLIKAECCPLREPSVSIHESLRLLSNEGYLQLGTGPNGRRYGRIVNFREHQTISRPTASKIKPLEIVWDDSENTHGVIHECSTAEQGTGNREQGKEQGESGLAANGGPVGPPPCPHQEIIDLYHEILPELPRVRIWNDQRKRHLQARWREDPERQDPDWWRRFFTYVHRTQGFLLGQNDRGWKADLEWIVTAGNFAKTIEGARYRAREPA